MEPALSSGDIPAVLELLRGAISNDAATQKQAEGFLSALEPRQGFCSCLVVRLAPLPPRSQLGRTQQISDLNQTLIPPSGDHCLRGKLRSQR